MLSFVKSKGTNVPVDICPKTLPSATFPVIIMRYERKGTETGKAAGWVNPGGAGGAAGMLAPRDREVGERRSEATQGVLGETGKGTGHQHRKDR